MDEALMEAPARRIAELADRAEPNPDSPLNDQRHRVVIEPESQWKFVDFADLWRYRELLYFLAARDVKVRYKQTALGAAWAIIQPAMMMIVFTYFFHRLGKLSSGDVPYPLFACAGLLPWMLYSQSMLQASNSIIGSERLISKIYFPRLLVPLASIGAVCVDFLVGCSLLVVMLIWNGHAPSVQFPIAILALAALLLHASAAGILLAALNVRFRDFRYVVPFAIQLLMFATPTIYMALPQNHGSFFSILLLNPITPLIQAFRAGLLGGEVPWLGLSLGLVTGVAALALACAVFRKQEDAFADVI
jgi:lipopolysaccharide transport system permease protein